jgi:hypothetical protein
VLARHHDPNTVIEKLNTYLGFNYTTPNDTLMAQSALKEPQSPSIEQLWGGYKIHRQGNSLTVTVPRRVGLDAESVVMRAGTYRGQVIYLKAIPSPAASGEEFGVETVVTTDTGETIVEDFLGSNSVRDSGDDSALTIPSKYTDRFPKGTYPLVASARTTRRIDYLKIVPVCVHENAESVADSDLVQAVQTFST